MTFEPIDRTRPTRTLSFLFTLVVWCSAPGCGEGGGQPDAGATPDSGALMDDGSVPDDSGLGDGGVDAPCDDAASPFGGGTGSESDPFLVCSPAQWMALDADASAHYRLTADLDFAAVTYVPVVDFRGSLEGGAHTLRNITIVPSASAGALFDQLNGATLRDLRVANLSVSHAGPAAGVALGVSAQTIPTGTRASTLENIHVAGSVTSTGGDTRAAGCLGTFARGSAVGLSFEGSVTGHYASGLADWVQTNAMLRQARVDATLHADKAAAGIARMAVGSVREAAAHGSATAGLHAAGLVGVFAAGAVLEDAYSDMSLTLDFGFPIDPEANYTDQSYRAAGALTEPRHATVEGFSRVYFAGTITATNPPMGEETVTAGLFSCWGGYTGCGGSWVGEGCYWDTETSGESEPGGGRSECVGLTSAELRVPSNTVELTGPVWTNVSGSPPRLAFEPN